MARGIVQKKLGFDVSQMAPADRNPFPRMGDSLCRTVVEKFDLADFLQIDEVLTVAANERGSFLEELQRQLGDAVAVLATDVIAGQVGMDIFDLVDADEKNAVSRNAGDLCKAIVGTGKGLRFRARTGT